MGFTPNLFEQEEPATRPDALPFDPVKHSRRDDPRTSKSAAFQAKSFADGHCSKILSALKGHGPMGKTRIASATGIDHIAVARRLADLQKADLAEPTKLTEPSAAGRAERIWRAL